MKYTPPTKLAVASLIAAAVLTACGGGSDGPLPDKLVAINFAALNGSTPVKCGTQLTGLGTTGVAADVKDLRFYITNLSLVNDKGVAVAVKLDANKWQLTQGTETVSLIDLEDATGACATAANTAETNAVVTGTVPGGTYVGLKATLGVPETMNHTAVAGGTPPLDSAALNWSWQSGRKFTKIELNPVGGLTKPDGSSIATYNLHIGSTGCTPRLDAAGVAIPNSGTCTNLNMADFSLAAFDMEAQKVALDLGQLFKTSNLTKENGGAAGCMSGATDPECAVIFTEMQVSFGSGSNGKPINGGAAQKIFKAVSK
ncbi:MAG: metallo-mystery pair system four-Cys motif protein [Rhodoferax sp.]|nr:metallo-mystery pair system four-Cys motif protein [Rhodoferax sp.]